MTRAFIRSVIIRAGVLLAISLVFLFTSHLIALYQENARIQKQLRDELSDFIIADHFLVLDKNEYEQFPAIQSVIIALDDLERSMGYIIDVHIIEDESSAEMRIILSDDAETIDHIEVLKMHTDEMPSEQAFNMLIAQFEGARIPVALSARYEEEYLAQNEYSPMPGLHDGVFYAELDAFNNAGYKDFVMITVTNGRIVDVIWDAKAQDEGKNRAQASVDGEFPMPEGQMLWAAQAYAIQNKLIEVQNPANLAIRSDGRTEIIENVEMNVQVFLTLVNRCIEDSLQNVPMTDEEIDEVDTDHHDQSGIRETSRPIPTDDLQIVRQQEETSSTDFLSGDEDGVVDSGDEERYLSESVDGLPLSEIRTKIDGLEDYEALSSQMVSGVNEAYKFVRTYLRWGG